MLDAQFPVEVDTAHPLLTATVLEPDTAKLLEAPAFSPAFLVNRTGFDRRGRAIEFAETLYRGDRYSYELTVLRKGSRREPQ